MVRITNPKGEEKILSNEDFDKLLWRFIETVKQKLNHTYLLIPAIRTVPLYKTNKNY